MEKVKLISIAVVILILIGGALYFILNKQAVPPVSKVDNTEVKSSSPISNPPISTEADNIGGKNFQWIQGVDKIDLVKISWNKIGMPWLDGFGDKLNVVEVTGESCGGEGHYLKTRGGLMQIGFCLAFKNGVATTTIDSAAKLKEVFAPVDNEGKAVSFVAAIASDYQIDGGIVRGYSASLDGYYLVRIIQKNTFGCGNHAPTEAVYKVTQSGDISLIAREEPPQDTSGVMICTD